jgi:DNA-binding response OmpR family regulator
MDALTPSSIERPVLELEEPRSDRVPGLSPVRVLLVEDDYDSARLVSRRLNWSPLANFDVSWAASLPEGLAHLEGGDYDAVILDLSLPGSEGMATIAGVSVRAPQIPIVVLTGSDSDQFCMTAIRNGVQDYLVKEDQDGRSLVRAVLAAIERQRRETGRTGHAAA